MTIAQQLGDIITDPITGPFEGEDYWIDEDGTIQISENNIRLAAIIMRKANTSGVFEHKLVKIGNRGDSVLLGFDDLVDQPAVYASDIGYKNDTHAEVKLDKAGKFCLYLNNKRCTRMFKKLASVKLFLKRLDQDLKSGVNAANEAVDSED
jgi:hypothetical protein